MSRSLDTFRARGLVVCALFGLISDGGLATRNLSAEESVRKTTSLRFAPENVSFYSTIVHLRQQGSCLS